MIATSLFSADLSCLGGYVAAIYMIHRDDVRLQSSCTISHGSSKKEEWES